TRGPPPSRASGPGLRLRAHSFCARFYWLFQQPRGRLRFCVRIFPDVWARAGHDSGARGTPMSEAFNTLLLVYAALFPIVNPVGGAPIFPGLTRHLPDGERHALALRIAINGFLLLLGSLFVGSHVLGFFGITLPVVRIAGGVVVSAFAWKLLHEGDKLEDQRGAAAAPSAPVDAFYPLTMPLTVGPGSISVAITLGSQRPHAPDFAHLAILGAAAVAGLLAIAVTVF